MQSEYHIWELVPRAPYRIRVELSDDFLEKLASSLSSNRSKVIRELNKTKYANNVKANRSRWSNWFIHKDVSMPLWAAMGLTDLANLSLEEMERCIVLYKHKTPRRVCIKTPKLPLNFSPTFVSFAAHFCFDGSLPRDGKGTYYSQKNQMQINNFIAKANYCFGEVYVTISLDGKGIPKIRMPRLVGDICKHVCGFESYGTYDASIPTNLLNLPKEYLLGILVSAIVDEGGVLTEYIQLQLNNKLLVAQLKQICDLLEYSCSQIKERKTWSGNLAYYFYLKSIKTLHSDLEALEIKHSLLSLTFKKPSIQYILKTYNFPRGKSTPLAAAQKRKSILESLNKVKTLRELSLRLEIPARTLRRHLKHLTDVGIITRVGNSYAPPLIQRLS